MALEGLKRLLDDKSSSLIDLTKIDDALFDDAAKIPMIFGVDGFPADQLVKEFIYHLRKQGVKLGREFWQRYVQLHSNHMVTNGYRSRHDGNGQIGLEILSLFGKLSADELFESITKKRPQSEEDIKHRDEMMEERILAVLSSLEDSTFTFTMDRQDQIDIKMRQFLSSAAVATILCDVITQMIKPGRNYAVTTEKIKKMLNDAKIYTCKEIGYLRGCALRDGWLVCTNRLATSEGDVFWADLYSLAIHEASHFCIRQNFNSYGFSSPSSQISEEDKRQHRMDPQFPNKMLELGRAAEISVFGGLPNGMQVNWAGSTPNAAKDFIKRVQSGQLPYESKTTCLGLGMRERKTISLSFGGDLMDQLPYEL